MNHNVRSLNPEELPVAVVGLGLMGCSITTCLLMAEHPVIGIAPTANDLALAHCRVEEHLTESFKQEICSKPANYYLQRLTITDNFESLKTTVLVIECVIENIDVKKEIFNRIEENVSEQTIITSNTSSIPISHLQKNTKIPGRFFGLHWAEPSHTTRFLEIICGDLSDDQNAEYLYELSHRWGKEATLVRKDIRGFITNRLMYALYREAFYLVENGYATVDDVDRACRNNAGYWMTLVGCFRWMDLTGIPAYHAVMKDLLPTLHNGSEVPKLMEDLVSQGARGLSNMHGFHQYTREEARLWQETFQEFSYDIRRLALKYPFDVVQKKLDRTRDAQQ